MIGIIGTDLCNRRQFAGRPNLTIQKSDIALIVEERRESAGRCGDDSLEKSRRGRFSAGCMISLSDRRAVRVTEACSLSSSKKANRSKGRQRKAKGRWNVSNGSLAAERMDTTCSMFGEGEVRFN